jgi:hypothetical protein
MIRGLIEKELRQHGFALGFLIVLPFAALLFIASYGAIRRGGGGGFEAVRILLYGFLPLASLVLGRLLVASEYRQKTQLFLEGLPLPRAWMLTVKFGLGFIVVSLMTLLALGYIGWRAHATEAITPRFGALLAARSLGWSTCVYSLFFAQAFLGRYRIAFGILFGIGLIYLSSSGVELSQFGPFALLDARFAFERYLWPVKALAVTAGLIVLFVALGFFLGLVRDATVAAMLAEKMSSREKLFLTMLVLAKLMVVGLVSEYRKNIAPVQMPGAMEARHGVVHVLVSAAVDAPSREETATLQRTANAVAQELGTLTDYLGCDSYPTIFIVHRRDLAATDLIHGQLKPKQGLLVRANLTAPGFKIDDLHVWLLRESLAVHTAGMVDRERNAWAFDAIQWWWPRSAHGTQSAWEEAQRVEHAAAKLPTFTPEQLHTWYSVRKNLGDNPTDALAGSSLAVLAERHGVDAVHRFLSARFAKSQPTDSRAWLHDIWRSTGARLSAATGLSEEAFTAEWRTAMAAQP